MNSNRYFPFILSLTIHGLLFWVPFKPLAVESMDANVLKGPASIEVSLVETVAPVEVRPRPTEEPLPKPVQSHDAEEIPTQVPSVMAPPAPMKTVGAITEEISSLLTNYPPVYPNLARMKGWEGSVILVADVNKNGEVETIAILSGSGYHTLDEAAIKAVRKWRFQNVCTRTQVKIPVKFILTQN